MADKAPRAPALFPELPVSLDELPEGLHSLSAQGCNACHYEVHDGWAESDHANSALAIPNASPLCTSCHLPLQSQQSVLLEEYGGGALNTAITKENPHWDATLASEGVTCAACHVREDVVVGTRPAPGAPHPVAVSDELSSSEVCSACHQLTTPGASEPLYDTYGEWSRSQFPAVGVRCQDCHMPPRSGLVTAGRYEAHADHALSSELSRAVSIFLTTPPVLQRGEPVELDLVITNTGAGHSVPTGSPFVGLRLEVQVVLDADDEETGEALGDPFQHMLQRHVSPDPPYAIGEDTRLHAGASLELTPVLDLPYDGGSGPGAVEVRLVRVAGDGSEEVEHIRRFVVEVR
ncbi:MAG TPA: hypothetical protein QGF58_01025 [Myxococcota bacterium]|nr:hypothetical protein [Myxococcota bacterium]